MQGRTGTSRSPPLLAGWPFCVQAAQHREITACHTGPLINQLNATITSADGCMESQPSAAPKKSLQISPFAEQFNALSEKCQPTVISSADIIP